MSAGSCSNRSYKCIRFFFSSRRRHTRLTCDWSSDVCSSDLFNKIYIVHSFSGLVSLREICRRQTNRCLKPLGQLSVISRQSLDHNNSPYCIKSLISYHFLLWVKRHSD